MKCRFCNYSLTHSFVNLGMSPLANAYIKKEQINKKEHFYPLNAYMCSECFLVQLPEFESPKNIFEDYDYFSSYSSSWLNHAKNYVDQITKRFNINKNSFIIEVASNDGYLLQYIKDKNIPFLGIEPAKNVAQVANNKGIETLSDFFGIKLATKLSTKKADLIVANNVLAHVPDINDFVGGFKILLSDEGVATFEFHHLLQLVTKNQFDTIYHEHFSYLSLYALEKIFSYHGMRIFDVQELKSHGGSLRIFVCHTNASHKTTQNIAIIKEKESSASLDSIKLCNIMHKKVITTKQEILKLLISIKQDNLSIAGYGAPAKGNTLLNYCGIRTDFLDFTVDKSPQKQKKFLPGTHIPIKSVEELNIKQPDYIMILPWNLEKEIIEQLKNELIYEPKFITPLPTLKVIENDSNRAFIAGSFSNTTNSTYR